MIRPDEYSGAVAEGGGVPVSKSVGGVPRPAARCRHNDCKCRHGVLQMNERNSIIIYKVDIPRCEL